MTQKITIEISDELYAWLFANGNYPKSTLEKRAAAILELTYSEFKKKVTQ